MFAKKNKQAVDFNVKSNFIAMGISQWLNCRVQLISSCVIAVACFFAIVAKDYINPGTAGVSISYALSLTNTLNWWIMIITDVYIFYFTFLYVLF